MYYTLNHEEDEDTFDDFIFTSHIISQGPIVNTSNRHFISLNGDWNYIVDPYETGYYNFHSEPYDRSNADSPAAFYNNYHAKGKSELVEYDFDKSPVLKVPGDWNTQ